MLKFSNEKQILEKAYNEYPGFKKSEPVGQLRSIFKILQSN